MNDPRQLPRGLGIAPIGRVRSFAFVVAAVIIAAWVLFRQLPSATTSAEAAVDRPVPRLQQIRSVSLDGEGRRVLSSRLRDVLETRPGQQLDTARLARDRDAMEHELAGLGYLAARVEPAVITFDGAGAAYITFEIDQGKLFHLREVAVTGPGKDAAVVTLARGDDAVRARIDQARKTLAAGLARRGKPGAVELSVRTDLATAAVDVTLATR